MDIGRTLQRTMVRVLPPRYHQPLHDVSMSIARRRYHGDEFFCSICESHIGAFHSARTTPPRPNVRCPVCDSRPRHRLLWSYLTERTDLYSGQWKRVLHFAPEHSVAKRLKALPWIEYTSADLSSRLADLKFDITDIPLPDNSYDVILCSHVLEHVPDDRKAMTELHRVLKPGGWTIPQAPLAAFTELDEFRFVVAGNNGAYREFGGTTTFEDWSATSDEERTRLFGQWNHVRIYGQDFRNRLEEAGFQVTVDSYARQIDVTTAKRLGIERDEDIFYCVKPSVRASSDLLSAP